MDLDTVCGGHGYCVGEDACVCEMNYIGDECDTEGTIECYNILSDSSSVCSGHGLCSSLDKCVCYWGYFGDQCELYSCYGVTLGMTGICSGKGICLDDNLCSCKEGYFGMNCEQQETDITHTCDGFKPNQIGVCSGRGQCVAQDFCNCENPEKVYGAVCEYVLEEPDDMIFCFGVSEVSQMVCSGHGDCVSEDDCDCNVVGWEGEECERPVSVCSPSCPTNAECIGVNQCMCKQGFTGTDCVDECEKFVDKDTWDYSCQGEPDIDPFEGCNHHGMPQEVDIDEVECKCFPGYFGTRCEYEEEVEEEGKRSKCEKNHDNKMVRSTFLNDSVSCLFDEKPIESILEGIHVGFGMSYQEIVSLVCSYEKTSSFVVVAGAMYIDAMKIIRNFDPETSEFMFVGIDIKFIRSLCHENSGPEQRRNLIIPKQQQQQPGSSDNNQRRSLTLPGAAKEENLYNLTMAVNLKNQKGWEMYNSMKEKNVEKVEVFFLNSEEYDYSRVEFLKVPTDGGGDVFEDDTSWNMNFGFGMLLFCFSLINMLF